MRPRSLARESLYGIEPPRRWVNAWDSQFTGNFKSQITGELPPLICLSKFLQLSVGGIGLLRDNAMRASN